MINEFPLGLFFLRHCKTQNNLNHRISGQVDSQIVDFTIDTRVLKPINVEHQDITIISSSLNRCVQTTAHLLKQCCKFYAHIYIDSRIIERGMGCWEGNLRADIFQKHPELFCHGKINPLFTPPHGESIDDFTARIDDFIQDLRMLAKQTPILVCAHNQSLKLLKYRLVGGVNLLDFGTPVRFKMAKLNAFIDQLIEADPKSQIATIVTEK